MIVRQMPGSCIPLLATSFSIRDRQHFSKPHRGGQANESTSGGPGTDLNVILVRMWMNEGVSSNAAKSAVIRLALTGHQPSTLFWLDVLVEAEEIIRIVLFLEAG